MNINSKPYPVFSLPSIFYNAGCNVAETLKCPGELIVQGMQAVVSAAVQSSIQVDVPIYGLSPTNLWFKTIADSAEGKDGVDKRVTSGFKRFASEVVERDRRASVDYKLRMDKWSAMRDGLKNRMRRQIGRGEDVEEVESQLDGLHSKKPVEPMSRRMLLDNFDVKSFVNSLALHSKYVFVNATEGASFFNNSAVKNSPWLLKAYSGETIEFDYSASTMKSLSVEGALATLNITIQPRVFGKLFAKNQDILIGNGLIPRFLPAYPLSQRGFRFMSDQIINSDDLTVFNNRIYEVLCASPYFKNRTDDKIKMVFSPQARTLWVNVRNEIEASMAPGGSMFSVPEFASRLANAAARMSANWQYFQYGNAEISAEMLSGALEVCRWHAVEILRIFSEDAQLPEPEQLAVKLEEVLRRYYHQRQIWKWEVQVLQRYSPRPMRNQKLLLMDALSILQGQGKLEVVVDNSGKWVVLSTYFTCPPPSTQRPILAGY